MTASYEPVLRALVVEPRVARPGETVCIEFCARNHSVLPSPPATVAFVLAEGLEPLASTEVRVEPVAPGEDAMATILARVRMPVDDLTALFVQAVLRLDGAELGTNRCAILVRSRPVFDGPASGTFVEQLDAQTVRVRAEVTNEGDGPAHDVRVVVAAPIGCERLEGEGPAIVEAPRLDVGQRIAFAFNARIVRPVAEICADDGEVRFGEGRTCALPARGMVAPEPVISAPRVVLNSWRRRVEIAVEVQNEGWVDARDVVLGVTLPKGMALAADGVAVDGVPVGWRARRRGKQEAAFARAERSGTDCAVAIGLIPAREGLRVVIPATYPAEWSGGTIAVRAGEHGAETAFMPEHVRDVRVHLIEAPRTVAPGEAARVVVRVVNAGDVAESLTVSAAGDRVVCVGRAALRALVPGGAAYVALEVCVDPEVREGDEVFMAVNVGDVEGERARREFGLVIRDRAGRGDGTSSPASPDFDRSERVGGENACIDTDTAASAVLQAPDDVVTGASFALRIDVVVDDAVDELVVRVPAPVGASYVAGTTALDGHGVLDRHGRSPLDEGLTLHDVPAGTRIALAASYLADASPDEEIVYAGASLGINGTTRTIEPAKIRVRAGNGFALRPPALAYHVDALTVAPVSTVSTAAFDDIPRALGDLPSASSEMLSLAPEPVRFAGTTPAISFILAADPRRLHEIERLLHGTSGMGLVAHVLALRALFPDTVNPRDVRIAGALDGVRAALHDIFDRLFVKLRIPGFYVAADDLEDPLLRSALTELLDVLAERGSSRIISRALIGDAPYGAPRVLRALVSLLPECLGDARLSEAMSRYGGLLDETLARYEGVPLELFEDALTRGSDRALDEARSMLVDVIRGGDVSARALPVEVAC